MQTIIIFALVCFQQVACNAKVDSLGSMYIHRDKITLSGFSSGGTFAQQLQFSYSSLFSGIAVFSHTFYRCGPPNGLVDSYDRVCTKLFNLTESEFYNPMLVHDDIQNYVRRGLIEDTANLRNKRLYVYTGLQNFLFTPRQSLGILNVYERYIGSLQPIFTRVQDANLVLPTNSRSFGQACTAEFSELTERSFFIGRCDFSGVTEAINFLLFDHLNTTAEAYTRYNTPRGKLSTFDQTEFTNGLQNHSMDTVGFYYMPKRCKRGYYDGRRCYLHFYFHGCMSGREFANTTHVENTGLLELADRKGIIMVFPQAVSSLPQNDIGCWDTFGISGIYYATQVGVQTRVMKRMLDRILGKSALPSSPSSSATISFPSKWDNNNKHKHNGNRRRPSYMNRYGNRKSNHNRKGRYSPFIADPLFA